MSAVQDALEQVYAQCCRRRLRIVRLRHRRPIVAAMAATYFAGSFGGKKSTLRRVRSRVALVGRLYIDRLWHLGRHELWLYQRGLSAHPAEVEVDRLVRAFKLAADCTPRSVIYSRPLTWAKACNRSNFCPYCWEATASRQIQIVRQLINKLVRAQAGRPFCVTTRIVEYFLSAGIGGDDLGSATQRYVALEKLRVELTRCKKYLQQQHKRFQRNTFGSIWRIVVIPCADGWRIQIRYLWVAAASKNFFVAALPVVAARVVAERTAVFSEERTWKARKTTYTAPDADSYAALIAFNTYPIEWLTEDIELVAVYLNAAAKMRLLGGTGLLKKVGSGLVKQCIAAASTKKLHDVKQSQSASTPRYAG